jgi:hypothetical protein
MAFAIALTLRAEWDPTAAHANTAALCALIGNTIATAVVDEIRDNAVVTVSVPVVAGSIDSGVPTADRSFAGTGGIT